MDSIDGRDRAPDRYTRKGRETIDRMRDLAYDSEWEDAFMVGFPVADILFAYHCRATALKYEDRDGAKGDPEGDRAKRAFYNAMADSVLHDGQPDPRSERPGFTPYRRPE